MLLLSIRERRREIQLLRIMGASLHFLFILIGTILLASIVVAVISSLSGFQKARPSLN